MTSSSTRRATGRRAALSRARSSCGTWTADATGVQYVLTLKARKVTLNCLAFSPDGALLAAGGYQGVVQLWDVAAGRLLGRPVGIVQSSVDVIAFASPDSLIAAGHTAYVWDVAGKSGRIEGRRWLSTGFNVR